MHNRSWELFPLFKAPGFSCPPGYPSKLRLGGRTILDDTIGYWQLAIEYWLLYEPPRKTETAPHAI